MLNQMKQWLASPDFEGDEEKTAQTRIANTLIIYLGAVILIVIFILIPLFAIQKIGSWMISIAMFAVLAIGRLFLLKGKYRQGTILIFSVIYLCIFALLILSGGSSSTAMFYFATVVLVAGFFLDARMVNGLTLATFLLGMGISFLQDWGLVALPKVFVFNSAFSWIATGVGLLLMVRAQGLFVGNLNNALALAREEITARQQAEDGLISSLSLLQASLEATADGILVVNSEGNITKWNQKFAEMWNLPEAILSPASAEAYLHAKDDADVMKQILAQLAAPELFLDKVKNLYIQLEERSIDQIEFLDGRFFECYSQPQRINTKIVGRVWSFRDVTERKRMMESLTASEMRYRLLANNVPDIIYSLDSAGNIVTINSLAFERYGYREQDAKGKPFLGFIHPDDREIVIGSFIKAIEEQRKLTRGLQFRLVAENGLIYWFELNSRANFDQNGRYLGEDGVLRDISQRKQTEAALHENQELLALFMQHSPIYTYIKAVSPTEDRLLQASDNMRELIGVASDQAILGKTMDELFPSEFAEKISADDRTVVANGEVLKLDEDLNGRHYATIKFPLVQAGETLLAGFTIDITERRRAEEALRESEQKHRRLFESMSQGVIYYSASGKIISANPAAERILGLSLGQLQGKTFLNTTWKLIREDGSELPSEEHPVAKAQRTGVPTERCILGIFNPRTNDTIWLSVTAIPFLNSEETEPFQVYSTFEDITDRKHMEDALRKSEAKFRAVVENSNDGILFGDANATIHYRSPSYSRINGFSDEERVGHSGFETVHPDDSENLRRYWVKLIGQPEISLRTEYRIRHKDGSWRWIETTGQNLLDNADLHSVIVTSRDITERKHAEDTLRDNAIRYRTLLDNLPQLVWQRDLNSVFIDGNAACARTLGTTVEGLAGKTDYDFYPVDLAEKYRADDQRIIENGVSETFDERFLTDGSERFARTTKVPLRDDSGRIYGTLGIAEDITERRLADLALRESEQRFREVLENSLDASYKRNLKTNNYDYLSPVFEKIFSYTPEEFVKLPIEAVLELIHPDDRAEGEHVIAKSLSGAHGSIYYWDYRFKHKNGQYRWLHDQFVMMRDAQGQPAAWIGSVSDITNLKHAEEDRIAREIAEQASHAKSEFISRMSHELRTPLNAILGFSQLLKMDELKPNQTRDVEQIYKSGRHLLNLVNEVLDIARIESGRMHISPEPVHLADTMQEALELIHPLAEARSISISLDIPASENIWVKADPQSLRQVLLNLLSNAVKYNRDAGEITITSSLTFDGRLRLQVRDTGEGIPSEKMERLFTPFDRLDRDSIEQEGTGLGLALSKGLVEAMGGRIGADSQPGKGSTFWLELKLVTERLAETLLAEVDEHLSERLLSSHGLVLYVEDNLDNLKLVEAIMERLPQVQLNSAMQGRMALELAQEHHPDLILLDLHLPDMHGSEVLRRLKAEPATKNIPVIIISADATPENIKDLLAGGARAYLTKPIDIQEFLKVVEESLVETTFSGRRPNGKTFPVEK